VREGESSFRHPQLRRWPQFSTVPDSAVALYAEQDALVRRSDHDPRRTDSHVRAADALLMPSMGSRRRRRRADHTGELDKRWRRFVASAANARAYRCAYRFVSGGCFSPQFVATSSAMICSVFQFRAVPCSLSTRTCLPPAPPQRAAIACSGWRAEARRLR
jgi:hypothetical protein